MLIKAGADVAQANDYGRTALHYAAMQGNYYACTGPRPLPCNAHLCLMLAGVARAAA